MRLMYWDKDGGPESTCWGFWPIEIKSLFSIALLKFVGKSREVYHTHAFNSISWLLKGELVENHCGSIVKRYKPSLIPIVTRRSTFHRVDSVGISWALTFRGPWVDKWHETSDKELLVTLTHGRKIV